MDFTIVEDKNPQPERKRVCCNCGNNNRIKDSDGMVMRCECAVHGHLITYIQCFEGWCNRWRKGNLEK